MRASMAKRNQERKDQEEARRREAESQERKRIKDQEREMLKAGFLQNMQNLEQSQVDLNSQLQQLKLSEDPEGDSDILDLTTHLAQIGPELGGLLCN